MNTTLKQAFKLLLIILSLFSMSIDNTYAMKKVATPMPTQNANGQIIAPKTIIFGVYPTALYDFDTKQNSFKIDFYAWWRTPDSNYHPEHSVEIVNAEKYTFKFGKRAKNGDEYFTNGHYYAKINQYWNPTDFPFDHQTLLIHLEDFDDINHIVFEPDYEQSDIHPEISIPNWTILNFQLHRSVTHYNTNLGDTSTPKGLYSRLTLQIDLKHDGWIAYFNYFIAFFVTAFLSILLFFMNRESLEVKMLIVVSAVFAFIGNKYVLDTIIADSASYSLANLIQIATFLVLIFAIISLIHEKSSTIKSSNRRVLISHTIGYILSFLYILCVGIATYYAVIS